MSAVPPPRAPAPSHAPAAPSRARAVVAAAAAAPLLALLALAARELPPPGQNAYARLVLEQALPERQVQNAVALVNFDVRGLDTLGEELILLAAVTGTTMLLRRTKEEREQAAVDARPGRAVPPESEVVKLTGTWLALIALVFGVEIVTHGHLSPGGGFQGGAIAGTALAMIYLAQGYQRFEALGRERWMLPLEALGALVFLGVGVGGLVAGGGFMENLLPLGQRGELLSGGTVFVLDLAVGLEVAAGIALVLARYLHQLEELREGAR